MDPQLQRFYEAAVQLAAAAHFDAIELGVVYGEREPRRVFAMRTTLVRRSLVTARVEPLNTSVVGAWRVLLPLDNLDAVLGMLSTRRLQFEIPELQGATSIRLTADDAEPLRWNFNPEASDHGKPVATAYAIGADLKESLGELELDTNKLDRVIARESNYRYASLERVVRAFTGEDWNRARPSLEAHLIAPWPVHSLSARHVGHELHVEIEGLPRLDSKKFILNIEGEHDDVRLDRNALQWLEAHTLGTGSSSYKARLEVPSDRPAAINLFIEDLPDVSRREKVSQESPSEVTSFLAKILRGLQSTVLTAPSTKHRLTALRISNYRLLRAAELSWEAQPLTVLVGPNQSGKSTVLDVLQLLADSARGRLADALLKKRGGLPSVQSRGISTAAQMIRGGTPGVRMEADLKDENGVQHRYRLRLRGVGSFDYSVEAEDLLVEERGKWRTVFVRQDEKATFGGLDFPVSGPHETLLSQLQGAGVAEVAAIAGALSSVAVYPSFRIGPAWAPESVPMRLPGRPEPGARLETTGDNLAAALYSLREEQPHDWKELLGVLQLIFPVQDIHLRPVAKGTLQLEWEEQSGEKFDASELSDGTLGLLATFCALYQRDRALIAIDEPEQHLHPDALLRLVGVAQSLSVRQPILFTTQSDTLIGLLDETPDAIVIARRDDEGTQLIRPQLSELQEWLKTFSLREMRRELEGWNPPA